MQNVFTCRHEQIDVHKSVQVFRLLDLVSNESFHFRPFDGIPGGGRVYVEVDAFGLGDGLEDWIGDWVFGCIVIVFDAAVLGVDYFDDDALDVDNLDVDTLHGDTLERELVRSFICADASSPVPVCILCIFSLFQLAFKSISYIS